MFRAWSPSHLAVLGVFVAVTVALLAAGHRLRDRRAGRVVSVVLAVATLAFGVASTVDSLVPFHARSSLPFEICDLAPAVVAWALLSEHPTPTAVTYFWGLTLSVQALVQPTLTSPYPSWTFLLFWGKHLCLVWGAVHLCLVLRHGPDWRGYRRALAWTALWLVVMLVLNPLIGANYGYVNHKPASGSVLDWFGPWPVYLLVEVVIVAGGWALLTLPWVRGGRRPRE